VLSRVSRLLVDANRPEDSPTLFREHAEGEPIELNTIHLDDAGRRERIERFSRPYHSAVDEEVGASRAPIVLAMHTFTPLYEGTPRTLEIGVLFDDAEPLAERVLEALRRRGLRAEPNEPYSGKEGLMYAVDRHARAHRRQALELEVRQDLAVDPAFRADLVALLCELFA
jgi:predicted N-formylglutamate amidohydrolase